MSDLLSTETRERRRGMLRTAMGPAIALALEEPDVVEVLVNPDGRLWLDRHGSGRSDTGVILTPHEAERIIREAREHGAMVSKKVDGKHVLDRAPFDPNVEEYQIVAPIAGG